MIIFDLDGTLADCEHRRHFVVRNIACDHWHQIPNHPIDMCNECKDKHKKWKADWKAFYEACDKDKPIEPVCSILDSMMVNTQEIEIWSGRSESVRKKTEDWFDKHIRNIYVGWNFELVLKMRPIGDYTPDDQLKESWLDEVVRENRTVDFVFDDRRKVREMWHRRGIFVFDVSQGKGDF